MSLFPDDSAARKEYPVYSGLLMYFPSALAAISRHSFLGNQKHNPGQPLHHDRAKSDDEADALMRHLMEADYVGMAWRALSLLQKHLESKGAPIAPAARNAVRPEPGLSKLPLTLVDEATAKAILRDLIPDDDESPTPAEQPRNCS